MTLQPGTIIEGKYRINRMLGKGGMGAVYEGENERIHRRVAIKILHSEVSDRADIVQRFEREAQAAGRIGSAHIVEVLDLGSLPTGERFMVMEYLDGESLGARLKSRGKLTPHEFAPVLHALLEGLASAHEVQIVHRDLKPDNVYLVNAKNQQDFVKILDFGVSKFTALENDLGKTSTGMIMGTPYYMSPEQVRAEKLDARSDIYSVGVIVYYAVTGRLPFKATRFTELAVKITSMPFDPPESIVQLDPQFAAIINKAMARDRDHRFQTTREFQAAVEQWMATNAVSMPTFQRLHSLPPTSLPPGLLAEAARLSQVPGNPLTSNDGRPTPSTSSISGGVVVPNQLGASQLGLSHFTPAGTPNAALGISQPAVGAPAKRKRNDGPMIALGLFGTLFLAVCALLVYTFVIDKPVASATPPPPSAIVAAPPPPATTSVATPAPVPTPQPTASVQTTPASSQTSEPAPTTTTRTSTKTSSGGGGSKTPPPPNTGRKMTGEL
jgi:serine/threonine-protein kinase